jgi:hypothetical protein
MLKRLKEQRLLKRIDALELVPLKVHDSTSNPKGLVIIKVPRSSNGWIIKALPFLKVKYNYIELDELGSAVWNAIDGVSNAREIAIRMEGLFGNKFTQANERVVKFLSGLYYNKHITFKQLEVAQEKGNKN